MSETSKFTLSLGNRFRLFAAWLTVLAVVAVGTGSWTIQGQERSQTDHRINPVLPQVGAAGFNTPGNILISDQFNNRVIEVDSSHHIIWHFGDGSVIPGPNSVVGVNDAQRVGNLTLISGTGIPPGADPGCTNPSGCADNRVMLVNRGGHIIWQYGQAGVTGSGPNQLNTPVQATYLPNNNILITDQGNQRVIEVTLALNIVWQYGMTGVAGSGFDELNSPNSAELLENGDILIADESNNRVIEVDPNTLNIVWQYGDPSDPSIVNGAAFASRLPNGNTLITDSGNNRILEVTPDMVVVFTYYTNVDPNIPNPLPTRAVRLKNGNTLISDQFNERVIEIDPNQNIVWQQGVLGQEGSSFDHLNAPYDAKAIGDYTGLTPPPPSLLLQPER